MHTTELVPIDGVIFDYGEVISERADPIHMSNMARITGLPEPTVHDLYWKFRDQYDSGALHGKTYWQKIGEAAGLSFSPEQTEALVREDVVSWSRIRIPVLHWISQLQAAGVKTAILSNMMVDLLAHLREQHPWLNAFTHQCYSCSLGIVKPDERIYRCCLEGLGTVPERTLFLDDREPNIIAARKIGMHGIVFRGMDALRKELSNYALPLPS